MQLVCGYLKEVISLLRVHSSLLSPLSTILQHNLTSSQNAPLPEELEAIQFELDKIYKEQEEEKEREKERGREEEREKGGEEERERKDTEISEDAEGQSSNVVIESDVENTSKDSAAVGEDWSMLEVAESSGELQLSGVDGTLEVTPEVDDIAGCLPVDRSAAPVPSVDQPNGHVNKFQAISDGCGVSNDLDDVMLHKRPGRIHRKSNSWSGIPDDIMVGP